MGTARGNFGRVAGGILVALLAAASFPPSLPARAGDPVVAETLFKTAREAFQRRRYDDAAVLFRKAFDEHPERTEALYWNAASLDKGGDGAAALAAYREYLAAVEARGEGVSREERRLQTLAGKRVDALAAGEREFRKREDRYVEDLLALAKGRRESDAGTARRALERLLAARPSHAEARRLFIELGGKPPEDAGEVEAVGLPAPFRAVLDWKDLLSEESFSSTGTIAFEDGRMVMETRGGTKVTSGSGAAPGPLFAYETEFRLREAYEEGWLAGLTFGERGGTFLAAFVRRAEVILFEGRSPAGKIDLASKPLTPLDADAWHRLGVIVRGQRIEVWLDGKQVIDHRYGDRETLEGSLGLWQQGCRTERRILRAGRL